MVLVVFVVLDEAEWRFCAFTRSVLAFWLLFDAEEAWDEERRCGGGSAMTQRLVGGVDSENGGCGLHECL